MIPRRRGPWRGPEVRGRGASPAGDSGRGQEPGRWQRCGRTTLSALDATEPQLQMAETVRFESRILPQLKNTVREAP